MMNTRAYAREVGNNQEVSKMHTLLRTAQPCFACHFLFHMRVLTAPWLVMYAPQINGTHVTGLVSCTLIFQMSVSSAAPFMPSI